MCTVGGVYLESRLKFLRQAQNVDGGWGYFPGKQSWFEPTTYAMLALHGRPGSEESPDKNSLDRAWKLLCSWQTADGSSRPNGQVQGGTWVTAQAVTLACVRGIYDDKVRSSVDWLLRVVGAESSVAMRAAAFFHLLKTKADVSHQGWPWRDGNASWIEPTVQALLALKKVSKSHQARNSGGAWPMAKRSFSAAAAAMEDGIAVIRMCSTTICLLIRKRRPWRCSASKAAAGRNSTRRWPWRRDIALKPDRRWPGPGW